MIEICRADELNDGGDGRRFTVDVGGYSTTGFVVRYRGRVVGYLNRCAHVAMELDWQAGKFFDFDAEFIVCATHGALYDPASGACAGGPCSGRGGLRKIVVVERDGAVFWQPDDYVRAPTAS